MREIKKEREEWEHAIKMYEVDLLVIRCEVCRSGYIKTITRLVEVLIR